MNISGAFQVLQDMGAIRLVGMISAVIVITVFFSWLGQRDKGVVRARRGGSTGQLDPAQAVAEALKSNRDRFPHYAPDRCEALVVELGTVLAIAGNDRLDANLASLTPSYLDRAAVLAETVGAADIAAYFRDLGPLMKLRQSGAEEADYAARLKDAQDRYHALDVDRTLRHATNATLEARYDWRKGP